MVTEFVTLDGVMEDPGGGDIADGRVRTARSVNNADKLRHLGAIADVRALLARRRRTQPDR